MSRYWKAIAGGLVVAAALAVVLAGAGRSREGSPGAPRGPRLEVNVGAMPAAPAASVPSHASPTMATGESSWRAGVRAVDPTTVCMVNDRAMGKSQIPVQVGDQTYYGCCEMCKTRLAQEAEVRYAIDPVTGERVDKASAVIAERPDGSVLYFASEDTLGRFGKGAEAR